MQQEFSEFSKFRKSDKSLKHDWSRFKDPASHMYVTGTVVASWSLTQDVAGLNPFMGTTNIFVTEFSEFSENI